MTSLLVRGGHLLDPAIGLDRIADLLVDHGRIVAIDPDPATVPPDAQALDAAGCHVTPGWVDSHTHVYGDIGLDDPDTAGVLGGVTTVIDAGSSGSATVDELVAIGRRCRTDLRAIVYLDRRGIADLVTIPTSVAELPHVPIGELRQAIARHGDRIVAVKTGIYADLGTGWARLAIAAAELLERPLFVHVGNFQTHTRADVAVIVDLLDRLRPGDVVTHCYTAQPGGLLDERGELLPQALAAAERGVLFDIGHSGAGFDEGVARRALAAGLRPTTVSSDIAIINVRQRVRSLAHVLGRVWALGFTLDELIAMVTVNPRRAFGLPAVWLTPGAPADLTIFAAGPEPGAPDVRWTVKDGVPHAADLSAALAPHNIRFQLLDPPAATIPGAAAGAGAAGADGSGAPGGQAAGELLARLARLLPELPLDGDVLHAVIAHHAGLLGLGPDEAGETVRRAFADRRSGNPAGWLLAEQGARAGVDQVAARLAVAASVARGEPAAPPTATAGVARGAA